MSEQKKRGPKVKFGPRKEYHVKFSQEIIDFIGTQSTGMQAYLDEIIAKEMDKAKMEELQTKQPLYENEEVVCYEVESGKEINEIVKWYHLEGEEWSGDASGIYDLDCICLVKMPDGRDLLFKAENADRARKIWDSLF